MEVRAQVGEPDDLAVDFRAAGATVRLDAYPDLVLCRRIWFRPARWLRPRWAAPSRPSRRASGLDKSDPHLLPDLSAAVVLEPVAKGGS